MNFDFWQSEKKLNADELEAVVGGSQFIPNNSAGALINALVFSPDSPPTTGASGSHTGIRMDPYIPQDGDYLEAIFTRFFHLTGPGAPSLIDAFAIANNIRNPNQLGNVKYIKFQFNVV